MDEASIFPDSAIRPFICRAWPSITNILSFFGGTTSRIRSLVCSSAVSPVLSSQPFVAPSVSKNFQVPPAARCIFSTSRTGPPATVPSTLRIIFSLLEESSPSNIASPNAAVGVDTIRHGPTKCSYAGKGGRGLDTDVGSSSSAIVTLLCQSLKTGLSCHGILFLGFEEDQSPVAIGLRILSTISLVLPPRSSSLSRVVLEGSAAAVSEPAAAGSVEVDTSSFSARRFAAKALAATTA
mmetsp:Transcript_27625/g.60526  ORF Transcript_27625/g.60526 Transcript_27625/m.60526 type:complete len:238 (-) Transcript_27625:2056-2769(-)